MIACDRDQGGRRFLPERFRPVAPPDDPPPPLHRRSARRPDDVRGIAIGRVRLEQVDPERRSPHDARRATRSPRRRRRGQHVRWRAAPGDLADPIAVSLKALGQTEAPIERKGRNECRCGKPRLTQRVCDRRNGGMSRMPLWRAPCPGGYRPVMIVACEVSVMGADAESGVEPCAARRERIDGRRPGRSVAVRTDAIGAQRVDRDETRRRVAGVGAACCARPLVQRSKATRVERCRLGSASR